MSAAEIYVRELHQQTKYLAPWLPGDAVRLGDVGVIEAGIFQTRASLGDLGLAFATRHEGAIPDISLMSRSGVAVTTKLAGQASEVFTTVGSAEAGLRIDFSRDAGIALGAAGCRSERILDQLALGEDVRRLFDNDEWSSEWVVVTNVVRADRLTALVSEGANASVEISSGGSIGPAGMALASLGADVRVAKTGSLACELVGAGTSTPLFRAMRLKRRWWRVARGWVSAEGLEPEPEHETSSELHTDIENPLEFVSLDHPGDR